MPDTGHKVLYKYKHSINGLKQKSSLVDEINHETL